MKKGSVISDEGSACQRNEYGVNVRQITDNKAVSHQLYFLTTSFTGDGKSIVFASNRFGEMQYFMREYPDGRIVQLTDGAEVHGYSGSMNQAGDTLYFARGGEIWSLDLDSLEETLLARFEGGAAWRM